MRQAVKKPGPGPKRQFKAQGHANESARQPLSAVVVKNYVKELDQKRLRHASQVAKSHLISHFMAPTITGPRDFIASRPGTAVSSSRGARGTNSAIVRARRAAIPSKHPSTTAELLDRALRQATSHQEPPPTGPTRHNKAKRGAGIGAAIMLSVLVLGVVVNQNLPNVRLQMASAKAGFNAGLPDYRPAGYSLSSLDYSGGVVATQFKSNSDDRRYTITQKTSSWDSDTLRDSFVAPAGPHYQTVETAGRTIYLYNEHDATWVNGGIWYVIQSDGSLNDRQLVELATSF